MRKCSGYIHQPEDRHFYGRTSDLGGAAISAHGAEVPVKGGSILNNSRNFTWKATLPSPPTSYRRNTRTKTLRI